MNPFVSFLFQARVKSATALVGTFTLLCFPSSAAAQEPWDVSPFSANPNAVIEAAQSLVDPDEAGVVVLLDERKFVLDAASRVVEKRRLVYRIGRADAEGWSAVEAVWRPWRQLRPEIRARVITLDGRELQLSQDTIAEAPLAEFSRETFGDARLLRGPLPALTAGAVVEAETVLIDTEPFFDRGVTRYVALGRPVPVLRTRVEIDAPISLPLRNSARLLPDVEPARIESNGRVRIAFANGRLESLGQFNPYAPSDEPQRPYVVFSTAQSWREIADRYRNVVEEQIAASNVDDLVRETLQGVTATEEIAERLLVKVQQVIRYTAVQLGELAIVPTTPTETLELGYGDCKDQSTLLISMLRTAGIEAYIALLSTGPGPDVEPGFPGFGRFDHTVVYVPGDDPLWIDPTAGFSRLGQLPLQDQGRLALIASPDTEALVRIPELKSRTVETREVYLAEEGYGRIIETTESFGFDELALRSNYAQLGADEIRQHLEEYAGNVYGAQTVDDLVYTDPNDFSTPFRIRFEATGAELVETVLSEAAVAIITAPLLQGVTSILNAHEESHGEDDAIRDLVMPGAFAGEWRYRIVAPPGFRLDDLPDSKTERLGPALLAREFSTSEDGAVTAILHFDTGKRRYTADEVAALRKGLEAFEEEPVLRVSFEHVGEAHLLAGEIREALEEFRNLAELHPAEALHRTQIARALLEGSMGEAAREEARRAVELEPDSLVAHQTLGWVLQHDLIGLRFKNGAEPELAANSYRKALELDPSNLVARADLAILLEHDTQGIRYGPDADLDAAIEHYRLIVDQVAADSPLHQNLAVALLWANRFDELKEVATTNELYLAAAAATDGPKSAVREANRGLLDESVRQAALIEAGTRLVQLRFYEPAAVLLRAGARGAPAASAVLVYADQIGKTKRFEDVPLPDDDPRSVLNKMLIAVFLNHRDDFVSLFTEELRESVQEEDLDLGQSARAVGDDMPVRVILDLTFGAIETTLEGDDDLGYRATISMPDGSLDQRAYLVKENGAYRFLAYNNSPESLGLEVLRRLDAGDIEGARHWLDWAYGEVGTRLPGDDPLAGPLFLRFWSEGTDGDEQAIRLAAASLLAPSEFADRTLPILRAGRDEAGSDDARIGLDLALFTALSTLGRHDEALPVAWGLFQLAPDSDAAFSIVTGTLQQLDRLNEARDLIEQRVERLPDDLLALRALASMEANAGNYESTDSLYQALISAGKANGYDLNNKAWNSLHTEEDLASLLAEVGRTTELRGGATTKTVPFRRNPPGRWGLPSISLSFVVMMKPHQFLLSPRPRLARPIGDGADISVTGH